MRKDPRIGKTVQAVFRTFEVPRALKREARKQDTTVAELVRYVLKSYCDDAPNRRLS